jgi:hypothetical protein
VRLKLKVKVFRALSMLCFLSCISVLFFFLASGHLRLPEILLGIVSLVLLYEFDRLARRKPTLEERATEALRGYRPHKKREGLLDSQSDTTQVLSPAAATQLLSTIGRERLDCANAEEKI